MVRNFLEKYNAEPMKRHGLKRNAFETAEMRSDNTEVFYTVRKCDGREAPTENGNNSVL